MVSLFRPDDGGGPPGRRILAGLGADASYHAILAAKVMRNTAFEGMVVRRIS